jgi:hypothetical protein
MQIEVIGTKEAEEYTEKVLVKWIAGVIYNSSEFQGQLLKQEQEKNIEEVS